VTYARAGDTKKALEALRNAADKDFSNAARIEQESGFDRLRNDPRYARALEAVRQNKKPS
jgi:hypothetical protein